MASRPSAGIRRSEGVVTASRICHARGKTSRAHGSEKPGTWVCPSFATARTKATRAAVVLGRARMARILEQRVESCAHSNQISIS
jgi:hypothetical protein